MLYRTTQRNVFGESVCIFKTCKVYAALVVAMWQTEKIP